MILAEKWYSEGVEGTFREGEEVIAKDAVCSYWYALNVLKGRFELGEEEINRSKLYRDNYIEYLKSRGIEI